jgi:glyoxylase-like metal-dependent hydrolase (beta-lactamase superfamily II)
MQTPTLVPQKGIPSRPIIFLGTLAGPLAKHVPARVDHLIGEGDQIGPIRVLHTPGHTPGHLCFYLPERRALFTGDAFCTWPLICPGWPQAMLNKKQTWESLHRLAALDTQSIGVGHGPPVIRDGQLILRDLAAKGTV